MESALESVVWIIAAFLFWPAIVFSIFLSASGIAQQHPRWLLYGALWATPSALYLAAMPSGVFALFFPLCHVLGAVTLQSHRWLASLCICLYAGYFGWFFIIIFFA